MKLHSSDHYYYYDYYGSLSEPSKHLLLFQSIRKEANEYLAVVDGLRQVVDGLPHSQQLRQTGARATQFDFHHNGFFFCFLFLLMRLTKIRRIYNS